MRGRFYYLTIIFVILATVQCQQEAIQEPESIIINPHLDLQVDTTSNTESMVEIKQEPEKGMETAGETPQPTAETTDKEPIPTQGPEDQQNESGLMVGLLIGVILGIYGLIQQCYAEFRYVKNQRNMTYLQEECKIININEQDPNMNQKLVFASGQLTINDDLVDPRTGIRFQQTILIKRNFEMFQFVEKEHENSVKIGGVKIQSKNYSYEKKWLDKYKDSGNFHQDLEGQGNSNPEKNFFAKDDEYEYNKSVKLGIFNLNPDCFKSLKHQKSKIVPSEQMLNQIQAHSNLNTLFKEFFIEGNYIKLAQNRISDTIGDVRIRYEGIIINQDLTVIAQQNDLSLDKYKIPDVPNSKGCPESTFCCSIKPKKTILASCLTPITKFDIIENEFNKKKHALDIYQTRACIYLIYFLSIYLIFSDSCKFNQISNPSVDLHCGELASLASFLLPFTYIFAIMGLNYICYKLSLGLIYLIVAGIFDVIFYICYAAILLK